MSIRYVASCRLPTPWAEFTLHGYLDADSGHEHLALTLGEVADGQPVLCRVHSECMTGDALFSQRCDCGAQLRAALERIAAEGRGALLYLRQEGRGIGLLNKIRAYQLQDGGADTVEANARLGFAADLRSYAMCPAILSHLQLGPMRLMTNNPGKLDALVDAGIAVIERVALVHGHNCHNAHYLATKAARLGHLFDERQPANIGGTGGALTIVRAGARGWALPPCVLAVSDFDGAHGGHQQLLAQARDVARDEGLALAALVLAPSRDAPRKLTNLRDTLAALRGAGVGHVVIQRQRRAGEESILDTSSVRRVYLTEDPAVVAAASARAAAALRRADFPALSALLGRAYRISGHVVHGRKLGRDIGCPTLNIRMKHDASPLSGIFAVRAHGLGPGALTGVASIGVRPTVETGGERLLEVHVFAPIGYCYGKIVAIEFLKKIRDEEHFDGLPALQAAIARDVIAARTFFAE